MSQRQVHPKESPEQWQNPVCQDPQEKQNTLRGTPRRLPPPPKSTVGPPQEVLHTPLIVDKYLVGCAFPTSHHPTWKKGRVQPSHPFYPKWTGFTSSENRLGSVSWHPSQPACWRFLGMHGSEEQCTVTLWYNWGVHGARTTLQWHQDQELKALWFMREPIYSAIHGLPPCRQQEKNTVSYMCPTSGI